MKKLLIVTFLLFPAVAVAHGGVSKNVGNATVFLNQSPISPLAGEKVGFTFSITDKNYQALTDLPVQLDLIDTFYGDESKDKKILTQNFTTDANGNFSFDYTFNKENYFDVELTFADPQTHQNNTTGFLVQPRRTKNTNPDLLELFIASAGGLILGIFLAKFSRTPKH